MQMKIVLLVYRSIMNKSLAGEGMTSVDLTFLWVVLQ